MSVVNVLEAIAALSFLIIVHEAGHYFVARWCGMRVDRFSLGFGPPIIKWMHKGTQFQIAPILFGGFVHIVGMNPHEEYDENDPTVYPNRPTIYRFFAIFAGPATNMIAATLIAFFIFAFAGVNVATGRTEVAGVFPDKPAAGKLQPEDVIISVNGQPSTFAEFKNEVAQANGAPLDITVLRAGKEEKVTITPFHDAEHNAWLVGIEIVQEAAPRGVGLGRAAYEALRYPVVRSAQILDGLWRIVSGQEKAEIQGPVKITKLISHTFASGWLKGLEFVAMLSVYLSLINLLPLPALDGGRLAFLSYELATRRRPNPKVETAVHLAGSLILFVVLIVVTFNEVRALFS